MCSSQSQESITGIINEGEHVYISNVKVTKQGQGNLPILRVSANFISHSKHELKEVMSLSSTQKVDP